MLIIVGVIGKDINGEQNHFKLGVKSMVIPHSVCFIPIHFRFLVVILRKHR